MRAAGDVADELGSTVVLASMWLAAGARTRRGDCCERALATAGRHPAPPLATLGDLHVGLADVLRRAGRARRGRREHLRAAQELGEPASLLENRHRWYAAMAAPAAGPRVTSTARSTLLDQAEPLYLPGFFPDVRPIPAQRARVRHRAGAAGRRVGLGPRPPACNWSTTPSYLDEYDQLTLVRLLVAQHRADGHRRCLDDAAHRLDRLVPDATGRRPGRQPRGDQAAAGPGPRCAWRPGRGLVDISAQPWRPAFPPATSGSSSTRATPMTRAARRAPSGCPQPVPCAPAHGRRHADNQPCRPGLRDAEGLSEREVEVLRLLATDAERPRDRARAVRVGQHAADPHQAHLHQARRQHPAGGRAAARSRARPALSRTGPNHHLGHIGW